MAVQLECTVAPAPRVDDLSEAEIRQQLFDAVQPISLANCDFERFGEDNDGGYLLCGNLLNGPQAGYSYGIGGYDGWGCDVSTRLDIAVHEYDCFDTRRPLCPGGDTRFHEECVAGARRVEEGRLFETIPAQVAANGDSGKNLVMKIDVEGAEWDTLLNTPDDLLQRIDQLVIEFHGVEEQQYVSVVNHLQTFFYVAHLHYNNNSCMEWISPFPAWVYEVLFVNKRLGVPDTTHPAVRLHLLDMPNNPDKPDCQGTT
jgi:hypothetical protein